MQFNIIHVLSCLCFHHWFSFPVVDGFYFDFFKLVAKNNCYAVYISSPTHACSAYEPRPHLFLDLYGGCNYLANAECFYGDPIRAYRSSKTPDKYVFSVVHTAWRYSSQCLVTCTNQSSKFKVYYCCPLRDNNDKNKN